MGQSISTTQNISSSFSDKVLKLDQKYYDSDMKSVEERHSKIGSFMYYFKNGQFIGYIEYKNHKDYTKIEWIAGPGYGQEIIREFIREVNRDIQLSVTFSKGDTKAGIARLSLFTGVGFKPLRNTWKEDDMHLWLKYTY